ncbi:MAG: FxsA family protein [Rhodospirillales bacterium]|jgi:UPF0716 protein FxsA|nr:FxsA family protein [Rhodospirillales bacterium]
MGLALFTVMIVVPILEITVFILVGRYIGLWPTLACILFTALIGTVIIRFQGIGLIAAARKSIAAGEAPVGEVLQGLALLVAGALLITPGFITDTLGFLLLVPALRRRLAASLVAQAARRAELHVRAARPGPGARAKTGVVIEGEWQEVEPEMAAPPAPGRGWGQSEAASAEGRAPDLPPASRGGG